MCLNHMRYQSALCLLGQLKSVKNTFFLFLFVLRSHKYKKVITQK